ncbi:hypothetical protein [Arcanobacterium pinnipediorum]|uniref:Uncharacterized protein n=1 Tax=Arcanobacterium pinnipediorum TaxID=1503041 RepID=A0ABY5AH88_9ACTO|nr:hypothetical protein [Arcanobacterium pinnipediorum]USR79215.1 hypothetical protein NG665_07505 [Arcanobacterium pinnipediorum]
MSRLTKYLSAGALLAIVNSLIVMSPDVFDGAGFADALSNNATKIIIQASLALVVMGSAGLIRDKADSGDLPLKTAQKSLSFAIIAALILIAVLVALLWR